MGLNFLIKCSGQHFVSPFYHLVSDELLPHIKHLYPILSVKRFNEDLDFFEKHFRSIDAATLVENVKSGNNFAGNNFFLSFDDGLRQFYDVVAPILLQRGISATCFINTAFVDNKDMFYRLKASLLIEKLNNNSISCTTISFINALFAPAGLTYTQPADLLKITFQTRNILDKVAEIVEVDFQEFLNKQKPYLTSVQIMKLKEQGFTIGAHSVSHPYYVTLSEDEQVGQTLESIEFVKERFQSESLLFSFPFSDFGVTFSFFDRIANQVDMTFGTASLKLDSVKSNLQRIPMENNYRNAKATIKTEYLLFILKKWMGKHIIYR